MTTWVHEELRSSTPLAAGRLPQIVDFRLAKPTQGCIPPEHKAESLASAGTPAGQRLPLGIHRPWFEPPVDAPQQESSYEEGGHSCHLRGKHRLAVLKAVKPRWPSQVMTLLIASRFSMLLQHASLPLSHSWTDIHTQAPPG